MAEVLHGSARTTPQVRAELQASQEKTSVLAKRYGLSRTTVAKWRAGQQGGHAGHVAIVLARLTGGAVEDHIVHRLPVDAGMALPEHADGMRREVVRPHVLEGAGIAADGGAREIADIGLGHGGLRKLDTGNGWIKAMTLPADEFIRRFLLHVLPDGFHRIRHYGLFASAVRAANIDRIRALLVDQQVRASPEGAPPAEEKRPEATLRRRCCAGITFNWPRLRCPAWAFS